MKYMVISQFRPEDWEAYVKKNSELDTDRNKNPQKYPKRIMAAFYPLTEWPKLDPGSMIGFDIVEADSEEQIENHMAFWTSVKVGGIPSSDKWYIPVLDLYKVATKMK
jgi:hypothetical protein